MTSPFKIYDSVHGFIRFDETARRVIDSKPFQRMRYIRQMGVAYLIYPGATHTRFEHSLGVMELATRIYDALLSPQNRLVPLHLNEDEIFYWRQILRLAALCHDLGHLPFSHTAEKPILGEGGHELITTKLICHQDLKPIWNSIGSKAQEDILKLAVADYEKELSPWERALSQIITEDHFGADRMDYLIRDGYCTGVSYGRFDYHQLIDSLRILFQDGKFRLGITINGMQSVESLLITRYMMHMRVYKLPKTLVYTHHMLRFMCKRYAHGFPIEENAYLEETDDKILSRLIDEAKKGDLDAAILLKWLPAFQEIPIDTPLPQSLLEELINRFQDKIIIEKVTFKKGKRDFPVLTDEGNIIASSQVSPLLAQIPSDGKPLCLFAHPEVYMDVKKWVSSL